MSFFSRIIPNAVCCFHSDYHNDEDAQPSPVHPVQHTVARKPLSYAMINVPHEPEMTDVYAFRRLFTQSPACPHEDTPISGTPNRLEPRGSLDLEYTFNSGSPMPTAIKSSSIQKLSQHIKQKMSESRLSKNSSKLDVSVEPEVKEPMTADKLDANIGSTMLGISACSTGLSDILGSREGSVDRYDKDAESIKTPRLLSPAETIRLTHISSRNDIALGPSGMQAGIAAAQDSKVDLNPRISPRAQSLPTSQTPEKTKFVDALQANRGESREEMLKRLSIKIADGTIKPPNSEELELLLTPAASIDSIKSQNRACFTDLTDPETPQTIVKRLSSRLDREHNVSGGSKASDIRSATLLETLDPVLVEYIGRATPSRPLSSMIQERESSKVETVDDTTARDNDGDPSESAPDCRSCSEEALHKQSLPLTSPSRSQGFKSVHLFDMHISKRLASKSQATILSPATSGNTSRKSFDAAISTIPASSMNSITNSTTNTLKPSGIRAEHNRRPSDPHTRQLFERKGEFTQPYWMRSGFSTKSKLMLQERDDASSYYTYDAGPPSSAGDVASFDGARSIKVNPNSIAIGGRAASYDFPSRRSVSIHRTKSRSRDLPFRSLSTSNTQHSILLEKASIILNNYTDGAAEQNRGDAGTESKAGVSDAQAQLTNQNPDTESLAGKELAAEGNTCTNWLTVDQKSGWNYDITRSFTPLDRRYSAVSMVAPDANTETNTESAAEMWNRAYRTARDDPKGQALLAPTAFDVNRLRRTSSISTIRQKHQSETCRDASSKVVRRSQSVEPRARRPMIQEYDKVSKGLKKLSFLHLRGSKASDAHDAAPRKLRKRSVPQLSTKSSFAASKHSVGSMLRPGHTLPLRELLGIWGTFPADEREKRNGPAGEADSVLTRDFAVHTPAMNNAIRSPQEFVASRQLSAVQQALKALSLRVSKSARKKGRSVSFPAGQSSSKTARSKLNRLYRTKSSEWRGYMVGGGHRTSVSAGQLAEYPELESLPGEGLFTFQPRGSDQFQQYDGSNMVIDRPFQDSPTPGSLTGFNSTPTKLSVPQVHTFWRPKSNASLGEPNRHNLAT